MVYPFFFNLMF